MGTDKDYNEGWFTDEEEIVEKMAPFLIFLSFLSFYRAYSSIRAV